MARERRRKRYQPAKTAMMDDRAIYAALLRRDFTFFLRHAFGVIGGEGTYSHNWHIDAIAHELALTRQGENRRLIITMPPRHLKSTTASIAWVAWMLGHNPALRFITISYGAELAEKQGRDTLKILGDPMVRRAFPSLHLDRSSAVDFETSQGGGRLSTSLGGVLTGRGADYIIIDDPTKSKDAASQAVRESDKAWLLNTLMTRLNDLEKGVIILIMQRLHEQDLVGVLKERGGWKELHLPAIAQEDEHIAVGPERSYSRRAGHALHPFRQSVAILERQKQEMGSANFAAQYLQEPVPAAGNLVKADWLQNYCSTDSHDCNAGRIIQSWDTASKDSIHNDWSVCITAQVGRQEVRILDVFRRRLLFPDLQRHTVRLAREHCTDKLLIEDQSSGTQLIQTLRSNRPANVPLPLPQKPEGDKISRLAGVSAIIEAGQLLLPQEAPWLAAFKSELLGFPNARNDDQVDALSQLLAYARKREFGNGARTGPRIRWL